MPSLVPGRVIYPRIAIPDPQGQNPKAGRPFVVISAAEDIQKSEAIFAVGITGTFEDSQADLQVSLPYGPNARSGLKKQSAALCTWVIDTLKEQVDIGPGFINPSLVAEIVRKVSELNAPSRVVRPE